MKNVVVTIARKYGSGGRQIGSMLAKELGVNVYNRELLKLASEDSGINEALFSRVDERLKQTTLFGIMRREYKGELIPPESDDFLSNQNLFNYQAKVIKGLAETASCVIIGRCADFVLKDYPNVVRVFVTASPEYCKAQAIERGSTSPKEVDKYVSDIDKYRGSYYKFYTGHDWTDARNYDLCLNSEKLGPQGCVDVIKSYIQIRFGTEE